MKPRRAAAVLVAVGLLAAVVFAALPVASGASPGSPGIGDGGTAVPASSPPPGALSAATCNWNPFTWGGCISNVGSTISSWGSAISNAFSSVVSCITNAGGCVESAFLALAGDIFGAVDAAIGGLIFAMADIVETTINEFADVAMVAGVWSVPIFVISLAGFAVVTRFAIDAMWDAWTAGGWL